MRRTEAEDHGIGSSSTSWVLSWQAAVGRSFFCDPTLAHRIRERLLGAHERDGRVLVDYLLTPGELHAISSIPSGDSVGGVARAFGNVVSRWVREAEPLRSPVLAGPFSARRIASAEALRDEVRALAWRPVVLGLSATPTHYPHGALRILLGLTPARGFDARPVLREFGDSVQGARAALRRWVARRPSERAWREWELSHGLQLATGAVGPRPTMAKAVNGAAAALIAAGGSSRVEGALRLLEVWVAAKLQLGGGAVLRDVSTAAGARGRALVALLAVRHHVCSAASVARYFGRAKATLSEQMAACRRRPADRQILDTPVQRILDEATALLAAESGMRAGTG
ncbi:MAG: hypothetical protein KF891_14950 [Rhizobacter sp.]|nr:hypothetical protein [Rhizobacter sp.]